MTQHIEYSFCLCSAIGPRHSH